MPRQPEADWCKGGKHQPAPPMYQITATPPRADRHRCRVIRVNYALPTELRVKVWPFDFNSARSIYLNRRRCLGDSGLSRNLSVLASLHMRTTSIITKQLVLTT